MADLALGAARSVVEGTLAKVQLAIETEAKLRKVAQSDLAFITEEFQTMQSFLEVVDESRAKNKVVRTWVGQVRDLAYDVEDGMEFVSHLDTKSDWWHRLLLPCMSRPLDQAVAELKQLKARVEDVSNRNIRYNLISESGFNAVTQQQLVSSVTVGATSLDMLTEETTRMKQDLASLTELITKEEIDLRVIWVWGTGDDLGFMSIVRKAYQTLDICQIFPYRGWFKLTHPSSPHEVLRSLMAQFYTNSCLQNGAAVDVDELVRMEEVATTQVELIKEFMKKVHERRYLVVLENVSTMGEWDAIRTYLPDRKNGSLIIVSTQQSEIASLGVGNSYQVLEMRRYSASVLFEESPQGKKDYAALKCCSRIPTSKHDAARSWKEKFTLVGRESQMDQLRKCLAKARVNGCQVMAVCRIPGVGKSALVRCLYSEIILYWELLDKYSWVDVSHPFNLRDFCQSLLSDIGSESSRAMGVEDLVRECHTILKEHRCLVVIDELQFNEEWDLIQPALLLRPSASIIIVITNATNIARHCADRKDLVVNVTCLEQEAAIDLFKNKVRQMKPVSPLAHSTDFELRELIPKCGGIPKVIVAVADVLAPMMSMRALNFRFFYELESNKVLFGRLRGIFDWLNSYIRTCPDFLKRSTLYLSIFPQYHIIQHRRLVMRWIAESYCKHTAYSSEEGSGEYSFSKLVGMNMIQVPPHFDQMGYGRMVFCQVNDFFNGYFFSRAMEENLVIELEGRWLLTTRCTGRHLVIHDSWDRDKIVYESIDFSRLRSLTVFGLWEPFFISESMKVLRVLDLENATGVTDKDLEQMVKLLPRLKFLSLRGCTAVHHLPSSLGVLRQLETLDFRYTSIITLPASITKLKKLQYVRAGTATPTAEQPTACSLSWLSVFRRHQQVDGVTVSTGIEKLTALHTLGVVNVGDAGGKAILKELQKLTQLRKLGVTGVNKKNIKEFCSAISCHVHLESLSVRLSKGNQDCLDDINLSPENLQSLKLFGFVKGLPAWIGCLPKLAKLDLEITISEQVNIHGVLGRIRELCILRLRVKLLHDDDDRQLNFHVSVDGVEEHCYSEVKILDIACISSRLHVTFGPE